MVSRKHLNITQYVQSLSCCNVYNITSETVPSSNPCTATLSRQRAGRSLPYRHYRHLHFNDFTPDLHFKVKVTWSSRQPNNIAPPQSGIAHWPATLKQTQTRSLLFWDVTQSRLIIQGSTYSGMLDPWRRDRLVVPKRRQLAMNLRCGGSLKSCRIQTKFKTCQQWLH
jgi:hypothetical protein